MKAVQLSKTLDIIENETPDTIPFDNGSNSDFKAKLIASFIFPQSAQQNQYIKRFYDWYALFLSWWVKQRLSNCALL